MTFGERTRLIVELRDNQKLTFAQISRKVGLPFQTCAIYYNRYVLYGDSVFEDNRRVSTHKAGADKRMSRLELVDDPGFAPVGTAITAEKVKLAKHYAVVGEEVMVRRIEDIASRSVMVAEKYPRFFTTPDRQIYYWDDVVRGMCL